MKCTNPISIRNSKYNQHYKQLYPNCTKEMLVPCGKCKACLQNYINSWCFRFNLQSRTSLFSYFVTLTYDDIWLPNSGVKKSDVQKLFKRIRKHYGKDLNLKYYLISEYGPTTNRPHYHLLSFSDIPFLYEDFWKFGFVTQSAVSPERFVYVAKYHVIKGINQPLGKSPTFCIQSQGIGLIAFEEFELSNALNNKTHVFNDEGFPIPIPKYFKDKFNLPKYTQPPKIINRKFHKSINESIDFNTQLFIKKLSKKSKL